jgi:hypothetical protein
MEWIFGPDGARRLTLNERKTNKGAKHVQHIGASKPEIP